MSGRVPSFLLSLAAVLLIGTAGFLWPSTAEAQTRHIRFRHLTADHGLSQGTVHAILQDRHGFMWFGTQGGLNRWDGINFVSYLSDPSSGNSLSHSHIWALHEDAAGQIWVGTDGGGLNRFDPVTETFEHFRHRAEESASLAGDRVRVLAADPTGFIWLGIDGGGLDRIDPATGIIEHFAIHHSAGEVDQRILALYPESAEVLWVGTRGGLLKVETKTGQAQWFRHDAKVRDSLSHDEVRAILRDAQGQLWVATHGGLNLLDESTGRFQRFVHDPKDARSLGHDRIRALLLDAEERLWIATNGGLDLHQPGVGFFHYRHQPTEPASLGHDDIQSLFQDRGGLLWIGLLGQGVDRWNPATWSFSHHQTRLDDEDALSHNMVFAIHQSSDGDVWLGTQGGGLNRWRRSEQTFEAFRHSSTRGSSLASDQVSSVLADQQGAVWVGTFASGLDRLPPGSEEFTHFRADPKQAASLSSDRISTLFEDRQGDLWIGTQGGGLDRFIDGQQGFTNYRSNPEDPSSLPGNLITSIADDAAGGLWVGTFGGGLGYRLPDGSWRNHRAAVDQPGSLIVNDIMSLHVGSDDTLWVGTKGGGLARQLRDDADAGLRFRNYSLKDGLPNDVIYGILSGNDGQLWLSTNDGLASFDPVSETFRAFTTAQGLQGRDYNFGASYASPSGELFFGGSNGFNVFDPARVETNSHVPPVVLTALEIQNRPLAAEVTLDQLEAIELDHRDRGVTFEFAALDFTAPQSNRYAYRLEGFDQDWIDMRRWQPVTYTNIPPGQYSFRVRASNNEGVWNDQGLTIDMLVIPSPWKTWWAYSAYGLLLAALAWGAVRWRLLGLQRRSRELEATVARRTVELSSTVEQLQVSEAAALDAKKRALRSLEGALEERKKAQEANRAKSDFLSTMSHELRTPLNAVLGFAQLMDRDSELAEEHRESLGVIQRGGEHLLRLINEVLSLSKIEAGKMVIDDHPFSLERIVRGVERMIRLRAEEKNLEVGVDLAEGLPARVRGDDSRLTQVLLNLLGNAVKFTDRGRIDLRVAPMVDGVVFEVSDTGCGIADNELDKLFQPFMQTESGLRSRQGTGLGLAISRKLVRLMGGDIEVTSELGKGTMFRFSIPLEETEEAAPFRESRKVKALADGHEAVRVLVADDTPDNRKLIDRLLAPVGFELREAADGDAAVQIWGSWQPQVALLDLRMPGLDGYAAARRIRRAEIELATGRTILIAMTAAAFGGDDQAMAAGFDDVMTKPFRPSQLFAKLAEHLDLEYLYDDAAESSELSEQEISTSTTPAAAKPRVATAAAAYRVLVADDDASNRLVARRTLERLGYTVVEARDGLDVLEIHRNEPVDLILLDVRMPRLDGVETARRLEQLGSGPSPLPRPRIIAMTGLPTLEDRRRCEEAGMDELIAKPFRFDDLKAVLARWLPVEVPASASGAIDRSSLAQLRRFVDTADISVRQIVSLFVETAPPQLEELRQALEQRDAKQIYQLASGLRSTSANLGAETVSAACAQLERLALDPALDETVRFDRARSALARLAIELARATSALQREVEIEN